MRSNWRHDASAAEWLAGRAWTFAEWCVVTQYRGLLAESLWLLSCLRQIDGCP